MRASSIEKEPAAGKPTDRPGFAHAAPTSPRPLLRGRVPVTWRCRSAVRPGCCVPSVKRTCFQGRVRADRRRWERSKGCVLQRGWPEEREAGERDHAADPRQRAKRNWARAAWALRPQGAPRIPASLAHALVAPRIDRLGPLNLCASYGTGRWIHTPRSQTHASASATDKARRGSCKAKQASLGVRSGRPTRRARAAPRYVAVCRPGCARRAAS